jgi:hypothetical protein
MTPEANKRRLAMQRTERAKWSNARVEIPAWSDEWMRGARFGTVARVDVVPRDGAFYTRLAVRLDHPQIRLLFRAFACDIRKLSA